MFARPLWHAPTRQAWYQTIACSTIAGVASFVGLSWVSLDGTSAATENLCKRLSDMHWASRPMGVGLARARMLLLDCPLPV